jgi:thymidylate synthase
MNPNTRQAILPIFDLGIDPPKYGIDRVPCTMYYQFLLRGGQLDVIYVSRSTDLIVHLPYDICLAIMLRDLVAERLMVKEGRFFHFAGSLHAYRKDMKGVF